MKFGWLKASADLPHGRAAVRILWGFVVLVLLSSLKLTPVQGGQRSGAATLVTGKQPAGRMQPGSRVLQLPRDRSLGVLKVKDTSADSGADALEFGREESEGWEYLGEAMGDVIVPAGKRLRLWVHPAALSDLSGLRKLKPDDLHILCVSGDGVPDGVTPDDRCMAHLSGLTGLRVLMLVKANVTDSGLRWIRGLKSLTKLYLQSEKLSDAGMAHIAELRSLEILEVMSPEITDAGLGHLANLRSLRELYIWSPRVRGPGLVHLADLSSLRNLNLEGNHFGDDGLKYLKDVHSVKKLNLQRMLNLTDAGLAHVANLAQLTDLNLADTPIADRGLAHLSRLTELERLSLYNTQITDEGLVHLKALRSLKRLNIGKRGRTKGEITDKGLANLKEIKSLQYLDLPSESATDKGLADLSELSNLRHLSLPVRWYIDAKYYTKYYTHKGLSELVKLSLLEELHIAGPGVTDSGMSDIAKLTNLRDLSLFGCPVTKQGLARLGSLKSLQKLFVHRANITLSDIAHLNGLSNLTYLRVSGIRRDGSPLNISGLTHLEDLTLTLEKNSAFRDEDLACLAKLTRLKYLQLCCDDSLISDEGLRHLAGVTSLEFLNIGGSKLTDRSLRYLGDMRRLWHLRITGDFTDKGLHYLEALERLGILSITSENAFSKAALDRLRKQLPNIQVLTIVP